ncbi:MAG: transporter [Roseomonas mucosa]|nr:transporter [Roseomonas mucosa]
MEDSYADVISWARLFSLRTDDETKSESSIPYGLAVRLSLGLHIDFAATQRLDSWQFGLSGYAFAQIEDDTKNGIKIRDNRASSVILGPIASYGFFAGGRSWTAGIKTGFSVAGSHTGAVNAVILRLTTKL